MNNHNRRAEDRDMGLKFNAEVNLGHVISVVGLLIVILSGWIALNDRVTKAELKSVQIEVRQSSIEAEMRASKTELMTFLENLKRDLREDIKEIRTKKP